MTGARTVILAAMPLMALASTALRPALARAESRDQPAGVTAEAIRPLAPNHAQVTFRIVDAQGNVKPAGAVQHMEWVWSKATPDDPFESPALRVWLESDIPPSWSVRKITGEAATVAERVSPDSKDLKPDPWSTSQTIVVDVRAAKASLRLQLSDERGRAQERTLAVSITLSRPYVLIAPECHDLGVHLLVNKVEARHLFVGLSCSEPEPGLIDTLFFRSSESRWAKGPGLVGFDPGNRFIAFRHRFAAPARPTRGRIALFQAGTEDERGRQSVYAVYYQVIPAPEKLFGKVGLAPTYVSLDEEGHALHLTQYSLNVRAQAGYHVLENRLDASVDFAIDAFAFAHTPVNVPQAHFYTAEPRVSVRLPVFENAPIAIWPGAGFMWWGMRVANDQYGLHTLGGAELLVELRHEKAGDPGISLTFKFATLSYPAQVLSGVNYEEFIGAYVELGATENKPLALTFDFRRDKAQLSDDSDGINGYALALGVAKRL